MVLNFIAIALVISLLVPGSMLSAFDSPAKTERMAQLPVKQASLADTRRCTHFGQGHANRAVNLPSHGIRNLAIVFRLT